MSYQSMLKRELTQKLPAAVNLAEAALNEARVDGAFTARRDPPRPLADKVLAAMEQERKANGCIVSLRLDGAGWSAHILDPELEGMSSKGCPDPESAWNAAQARRMEKQRQAEEAKARA